MIKTHKELANYIAGKNILHLNSLGKDSILCLDWLHNYAVVEKIVAVNFGFMAPHPSDKTYSEYLKKKYPRVEFVTAPNPWELTQILTGIYQHPTEIYSFLNHFEFDTIESGMLIDDLLAQYGCDFVARGESRYESFQRATSFHKKGIVQGQSIYPLGMMSKKQVLDLIKSNSIKLHPQYKVTESTLDFPSYYKMRSSFIINPEFKKAMYKVFPLLELDEYRYERLLK